MGSSFKRRWVASVVLSGTLLTNSLPGNYLPVSVSENLPESELILLENPSVYVAAASSEQELGIIAELASEDLRPSVRITATEALAIEETPKQIAAQQRVEVSRGSSNSKVEELVSNAQRLIGIPYIFGGTTTNGFDCSGFVKYVYKGSEIDLPRTSYDQYRVGATVEKDQLQAGDLVFFTTYDSGASHVGIYIGDGNFIHAARSGIKLTSLSDSYYASRYLGARRAI